MPAARKPLLMCFGTRKYYSNLAHGFSSMPFGTHTENTLETPTAVQKNRAKSHHAHGHTFALLQKLTASHSHMFFVWLASPGVISVLA